MMKFFMTFLVSLCVVFAAGSAFGHPTKKNKKPTKAGPEIKIAREKVAAAKKKLQSEGKYVCCVKKSCDMCASKPEGCRCAVTLAQGKGVCGECHGGWQEGQGLMRGIDPKTVKPFESEEKAAVEAPDQTSVAEVEAAGEALKTVKRKLAGEGRFSCCIGGGCNSCALEGECACGTNLAASLSKSKTSSKGEKPAKASARKEDEGVCGECYGGWKSGKGAFAGVSPEEVKLSPMSHSMDEMPSSFAVGTMFRQGSGTSWIPESSPMYAAMKEYGNWMVMAHPYSFTSYTAQTGPRGAAKFYNANWLMASAQREVPGLTSNGPGVFFARGMGSLDPATIGRGGYPLLFQTGESNRGRPLVDRQHPHDFIMELAVGYSAPISRNLTLSFYVAPVGEPALGPSAFPHRPSALDNPDAPLGHHWQDSTHIASGVTTIALAHPKWKVEVSNFTGREPDENRWNIDRPKFDSWATRFSLNPTRELSMQVSYGHLREPEALEPGVNIHRITASVMHVKAFESGSFLATSFIWGRNEKRKAGEAGYGTNAFLVESTFSRKDRQTFFTRIERVSKDELFVEDGDHPHEGETRIFNVTRFTFGAVQNLPLPGRMDIGLGASVSFHRIPDGLNATYGSNPVAGTVFLRIRWKRFGDPAR